MMVFQPNPAESPQALAKRLLNAGYDKESRRVIASITNLPGDLRRRLGELDVEAARLISQNAQLSSDDPAFKALLYDFEQYMKGNKRLIDDVAGVLQSSGMAAGERLAPALSAINPATMANVGIVWNRVSVEALAALVDFIDNPAWEASLNQYVTFGMDSLKNIILNGIRQGWNPLTTAALLRERVGGLPAAMANSMMRTLQLQSYRRGVTASYLANADILDGRIRIATLDTRTCLGCVALHGQRLALDEEIIEHEQGRCTSIALVKGRRYTVLSGVDWFNQQPPGFQQTTMGYAAYAAWKDGKVQLQDFVQTRQSDIYGEMLRVASLRGLMGNDARNYYSKG